MRFAGSLEAGKTDCECGLEEEALAIVATEMAESLGRLVIVVAVASIEGSADVGVCNGLCGCMGRRNFAVIVEERGASHTLREWGDALGWKEWRRLAIFV